MIVFSARGWSEGSGDTSRDDMFISCVKYLTEAPVFARPMVKRFADVRVRELSRFRGFHLTKNDQHPRRTVPLPELKHGPKQWRIEKLNSGEHDYYLYDIGPRVLESDRARLDLVVLNELQEDKFVSAYLKASQTRQRDLGHLARFQNAIARRIEAEKSPEAPSTPRTREILGNADVFAVFKSRLPASADAARIEEELVLTAKLTYDEVRDFVRPSFDGLMRQLGHNDSAEVRLPFLTNIVGRQAERLSREFKVDFGSESTCQLSPLHSFRKGLGEGLRLRILLETYGRARRRGCGTIVTSLSGARFVETYGFHSWRNVTLNDGRRQTLYVLQVNSPEFNMAYSRIAKRLGELKP